MSLIRKNITYLLVSQVATWIATFAALIIVPNKLGTTDFGTFGYATGYVQFFTLAAGLGTSTYLARAIARDHTILGSYVWNAVLLKCVLWALLSALALAIAYAIGNRGETLLIIAISLAGMLPFLFSEVFFGALAGMSTMARPAMWMVVQVYFQTVLGITVLLLGWGLIAYTIVMTLGPLIPTVATALMVRPMVRGQRTRSFAIWRLLVVGGIPLLALHFFNLIYNTVDVPILHTIAGSDPVGWYGVALRWVSIPIFITTAVTTAYFPSFSQHGNPMTDEFAPLVNRSIHIVLFVTIPASLGLALIADEIISLLYDDYDPSIVLIQILAIQMPISAMDTVLGTALVASDRLNRYLVIAATAAAVNPIACIVAINIADSRTSNPALGAAWVMVGTELVVMLGALWLRAPGVLDRAEVGRVLRILLASALMAPALIFAGDWPLVLQVLLGVVVYAIASLAFGGISRQEVRDVIRQVSTSRRAGPAEDGAGDHDPAPALVPGPDDGADRP